MLTITMVILYFTITVFLGLYYTNKNKDVSTFSTATRQLGIISIATLVFTGIVGGSSTVGVVQGSFAYGIGAGWVIVSALIGIVLFALPCVKVYRVLSAKCGVMNSVTAFTELYGKTVGSVNAFFKLIGVCGVLATAPVSAAGILSPMLGISRQAAVIGFTVLSIILLMAGGQKGAASMSIVHGIVLFFGTILVAIVAMSSVGGFKTVYASVPKHFFHLNQPSLQKVIATIVSTSIVQCTSTFVIPSAFGAKSDKEARSGMIIGGVILIPLALSLGLIGIAGKIILPTEINTANVIYLVSAECGQFFSGVISMAVLAAIISSVIPGYLVGGVTITQDIIVRFSKKELDDNRQLWITRISACVLCLVSTWLGYSVSSIISLLVTVLQIATPASICFFVGVVWNRVDSRTMLWSMLVGGITGLVWALANNPFGLEPIYISLPVTLLIIIGLALPSKDKISEGWIRYRKLEEEYNSEGLDKLVDSIV